MPMDAAGSPAAAGGVLNAPIPIPNGMLLVMGMPGGGTVAGAAGSGPAGRLRPSGMDASVGKA